MPEGELPRKGDAVQATSCHLAGIKQLQRLSKAIN